MVFARPSVDVMDEIWGTDDHLWGPDVSSLSLDDEMEEIELGSRVFMWISNWLLATIYTGEGDKIRGSALYLISAVASATSYQGRSFPSEWRSRAA
jgi:hypothetical protein